MVTDSLYEEKELLLQFSQGDEQAFTTVYETFHSHVYRLAYTYLQDREDAIEVTQRIFVRLWEHRPHLAQVESLKHYVLVTARNAVFDYLKQVARQGQLIAHSRKWFEVPQPDPADQFNIKSLAAIWHRLIQQLPAQQKQVYELVELQGLGLHETAQNLGILPSTAKTHLKLARRYIRQEMSKELKSGGYSPEIISAILICLFFS